MGESPLPNIAKYALLDCDVDGYSRIVNGFLRFDMRDKIVKCKVYNRLNGTRDTVYIREENQFEAVLFILEKWITIFLMCFRRIDSVLYMKEKWLQIQYRIKGVKQFCFAVFKRFFNWESNSNSIH